MSTQQAIEQKLTSAFDSQHLMVENESHKHSVPPNSETHFKVTLVSSEFEGQGKVKRHQAIYKILADEMAGGVHAHIFRQGINAFLFSHLGHGEDLGDRLDRYF